MRKIDVNNFHVATSEIARDINRRVVLNLIRQHQPISRADLARQSGLQRSTVSLIAEQLIDDRWVTEGAIGATPRGRKPRFLHLNKARAGIIGVNIRPAMTTIGLANMDAQFLAQEAWPTTPDPDQFRAELNERVCNLIKAHPHVSCEGIGVSVPGRLDLATKRLAFAPNLGWRDLDLTTRLEELTGLPVEVENAANACALAEVWFGSHSQGVQDLITVTISEGIGAGIMMNGQIARGSTGAAGEFGHVAIVEDGLQCRCGNRGCWEMYASNSAAVRYYTQAALGHRKEQAGHSWPGEVTFDDILRLAEHGAQKAVEALLQMAHYIGAGLAMLVTGLAPDLIVIVGEVTRAWPLVGPVVEEAIRSRTFSHAAPLLFPTDPAIEPRLRGTIALVLQKHFGAPLVA